jgi:protein ImuB
MYGCIFIPDFPVEAILRSEPELRSRAVVVLAGRPPIERVVALNEKARRAEVEPGSTRAQLEAWDGLVFRARSEAQEHSAHAALLDCAQSFSPEIEETAPDTVLLNLAGLEPLLGPLSTIAADLAQRALQMGLEANVAVAANPDAALLAARGFGGVNLIPADREAELLGDLTVDVLFETFAADPEQAQRWLQTFDRWGVRKLRALAALPEIPVSERLGQEGIRLQKLARGAFTRSLRLFEAEPVFEESVELEFPVVLLEPLAFLLNRLLEQVCMRLGARALAAQELRLALELEQGNACDDELTVSTERTIFTRVLRLPVPMLDAKVFLKLLQLDLQAHPPGAPIVKIHLHAEPAKPRTSQGGLFLPVFPEPEKLELTLARIAGIVGEGRVGSAEVLDTHREGAFEMRHFAPARPEFKKRKNGGGVMPEDCVNDAEDTAKEKMSAVIALRLFRPPLGVIVLRRQGRPVHMTCLERSDFSGEIVWAAGPWRASGDWSEQEGWSRDEWDVAMPAENNLVLFRLVEDKFSGKWWVEGVYD